MRHPAFKIVLTYVIVGSLWIMLSDQIVDALNFDPQTLSRVQTVKGWIFVLFTGGLLYTMIDRYAREREIFARTLVESQERLQLVASATNDVVWDWNLLTDALWWNKNYYSLFGFKESDVQQDITGWYANLHPDDKERVLTSIHKAIETGGDIWSDEYRYRRADGTYAYIFDRGFVIRDAKAVARRMVGSMQDISQRKESEKQILRSRAELQRLTAYVESAREEERTRIAREIHDELGQALTALKMDVSWLEKKALSDPSTLTDKTQEMIQLIDSTIRATRRIATELRPGVLDNLGIQAAVEWQTQEFEHHTGIRCTLVFQPESFELDDLRSTALFRILQETLTNVARHAQATAVWVSLRLDGGNAVLEVRDNGKGITRDDMVILNSFGIIGIRERVSHLGGAVSFSGTPGQGTVVRITLPLTQHDENVSPDTHS